uniref:Mitochondrial 2-oxodicarboxylate carrier n=1 Tax=Cyprinus carpio TaxID=7962 RepID=A0A8C2GSP8_CYPCA
MLSMEQSSLFQIQRGKGDPNSYKGLGDCFKNYNSVYGIYKEILPTILAETPKRAVKALSVAGLGSGLNEALVANRDSFKVQPSTFAQARMIINTDGFSLRGLNKGLTSTLVRHGIFSMIYFGFYFSIKDAIPASPDPRLEFMRKFAIGLVSGTVSSCVNIPFDIAKSRIQGPQLIPGEIKYHSCFQSMALVYREEGKGLSKELRPDLRQGRVCVCVCVCVYRLKRETLKLF